MVAASHSTSSSRLAKKTSGSCGAWLKMRRVITTFWCDIALPVSRSIQAQANRERGLSRRVEKIVGYPPLCERAIAAPPVSGGATFASNALAAGVSVFELARIMGTSVRMIERHDGALLDGAGEGIAGRLDALDAERRRVAGHAREEW